MTYPWYEDLKQPSPLKDIETYATYGLASIFNDKEMSMIEEEYKNIIDARRLANE